MVGGRSISEVSPLKRLPQGCRDNQECRGNQRCRDNRILRIHKTEGPDFVGAFFIACACDLLLLAERRFQQGAIEALPRVAVFGEAV